MCLAPRSYDLVTHKIYLMKVLKKYSIDLMELSFEVKHNMNEGDYMWVTTFIKTQYDGTTSYLDKPDYIVDISSKEKLETQIDELLKVIEYIKEIWEGFTRSAAADCRRGKSIIVWEEKAGYISNL